MVNSLNIPVMGSIVLPEWIGLDGSGSWKYEDRSESQTSGQPPLRSGSAVSLPSPTAHGTCSRSSLPTSPHPHAPPLTFPLTALRSAPPCATSALSGRLPPDCTPATHTHSNPHHQPCAPAVHFMAGGAQHAGTCWRPLPPARAPPHSGRSNPSHVLGALVG